MIGTPHNLREESVKLLASSLDPAQRLLLGWVLDGLDVVQPVAAVPAPDTSAQDDQVQFLTAQRDALQSDLDEADGALDQIAKLLGLNPDDTDCPTLVAHVGRFAQIAKSLSAESRPAAESAKGLMNGSKSDARIGRPHSGPSARPSGSETSADPAGGAVVVCAPESEGARRPAPEELGVNPQQLQMAIGLFARGLAPVEVAAKVEKLTKDQAISIHIGYRGPINTARALFRLDGEDGLNAFLAGLLKQLSAEGGEGK